MALHAISVCDIGYKNEDLKKKMHFRSIIKIENMQVTGDMSILISSLHCI